MPDLSGVRRRARRLARGVTPAGRAAMLLGLGGWALGRYAGYQELHLVAVVCGLLLAVSLAIALLPTVVRARLELTPAHTVAGGTGAGVLHVVNLRPMRMWHPLVVVPVDPDGADARVPVRLPVLHRGVEHRVAFELPGLRRGVLQVGPAGARRTDPLGFFQRHAAWTEPESLFVRPRMVAIESLGPGNVADLEGMPSDEVSMSDLSFHALREYVRGDDLRHVHWRSSARTGQLHVRQYHDTRRSHAVVLVDDRASAYADPEEFELALSLAASLVVRVAMDDFDLTFGCGPEQLSGTAGSVLDACCRVRLARGGNLVSAAHLASQRAHDASQLVVATGSRIEGAVLQEVRAEFAEDVRFLGLRADILGAAAPWSGPHVLTLQRLAALPGVMAGYVRQGV